MIKKARRHSTVHVHVSPQTDKKYIFERLHKPLNRQKIVNRKTHKTAINRPVDHAGET